MCAYRSLSFFFRCNLSFGSISSSECYHLRQIRICVSFYHVKRGMTLLEVKSAYQEITKGLVDVWRVSKFWCGVSEGKSRICGKEFEEESCLGLREKNFLWWQALNVETINKKGRIKRNIETKRLLNVCAIPNASFSCIYISLLTSKEKTSHVFL